MTHAFFKALLFLGAGIVIHALVGEQDMRQMGGLRRADAADVRSPCSSARSRSPAIPPFAGFFSKDAILASALARGDWWGTTLFVVGIVGAFLTGLYTFRMIFMVFGGEPSAVRARALPQRPRRGAALDDVRRSACSPCSPRSAAGSRSPASGTRSRPSSTRSGSAWTASTSPSSSRRWRRTGSPRWSRSSVAGVGHLARVGDLLGVRRRPVPHQAAVERTLEHKLYFDEAYDLVFYRPAAAVGRVLEPLGRGPGDRRLAHRPRARHPRGRRAASAASRPGSAHSTPRGRGRRRRSSPSSSSRARLTDHALILVPLVARARRSGCCRCRASGPARSRSLVSLVEVGLWVNAALGFDFESGGLQFEEQATWFGDLGVSYHVGLYGFSLWLVGLAVV